MSKLKNVVSFAIGDVVDIAKGVKITSLIDLDEFDELVVTDCVINEGLEYSLNGSSWIPHECLQLVSRATPKTLALAVERRDSSDIVTESYDEDDDDFDEDYD